MQTEPNDSTAPAPTETGDSPANQSAFFRGTVVRLSFYNHDTGFGVLKAEAEFGSRDPACPSQVLTTIVGVFPPSVNSGTYIIARGSWQEHTKFGRQFRADSVTEADPSGKEAIEKYLGSGVIRGFGPVLAQRVVEQFGDATLQIIDEQPDRLREVSGIGRKKLQEILESWQKKRNIREVLLFFQGHGISLSLAQRIYQAYGDKAIEIVSQNPYLLARDVWGIGFHTADTIARALGTDLKSRERLIAAVTYCLQQAAEDGHCYVPREYLLAKTSSLLQMDEEELINSSLEHAALRGEIIVEEERLYLPSLHQAESQLARQIAELLNGGLKPACSISAQLAQSVCEAAQLSSVRSNLSSPAAANQSPVIRLSEEQKEAIHLAAKNSLLIITGGPGCGKTTVVRTIAQLFRRAGLRIKLAAPTGRAAQRLSEVCDMPASTIHRLLRYDPASRSFLHTQNDPLPLDVLIVDESSMIDIPLAAQLLRAVPPGARVVFVGDADQLPSVGPGLFFRDLLGIEHIPRVKLTILFRRTDESLITSVAHQIISAVIPEIPEPDGSTKADAYFLPAADAESASVLVERLVVEQLPKKFGLNVQDITVLSPVNQGNLGINALNKRLQQRIIPQLAGMPSVKLGELEFRPGDRVIQRVNNYSLHPNGVFNGDQGTIVGIDSAARSLIVRLWDGREITYQAGNLDELDLAYALTIHRSQGSEVPAIVLVLHDSHYIMLDRQLTYTAVTRAKKLLIIVGSKRALATAVKHNRSRKRYTDLAGKIQKLTGDLPLSGIR